MRRSVLVLILAAPALSAPAYAQHAPQPVTARQPKPAVDDVVGRLLSFDRNGDGKVDRTELSERMHPLVTRGDRGSDGALDAAEIRALASAPANAPAQDGVIVIGVYGFGDQHGLSSSSRIEGALDDLRLAPDVRAKASSAATAFLSDLETAVADQLMNEIGPLLAAGQLLDFTGAVLGHRAVQPAQTINGALVDALKADVVLTARGRDLLRRVSQYGLGAAEQLKAEAAVERFDARLRLREAERAELSARLQGVLSDEELDNLRAALARRPVIQAGRIF